MILNKPWYDRMGDLHLETGACPEFLSTLFQMIKRLWANYGLLRIRLYKI
jgi:hypothetical protein